VWNVEGTDEFADWFGRLDTSNKEKVEAAIEELEEKGPGLGRPWVDSLKGTELKELIPRGGFIRILFRFDPLRTAILLTGGDKQNEWSKWYERMIPIAEELYKVYLNELRQEGMLRKK
jgi:hypothetical protein